MYTKLKTMYFVLCIGKNMYVIFCISYITLSYVCVDAILSSLVFGASGLTDS